VKEWVEREGCRRDLQCLLTSKVFDVVVGERQGGKGGGRGQVCERRVGSSKLAPSRGSKRW
jgi:hypothetical protein